MCFMIIVTVRYWLEGRITDCGRAVGALARNRVTLHVPVGGRAAGGHVRLGTQALNQENFVVWFRCFRQEITAMRKFAVVSRNGGW